MTEIPKPPAQVEPYVRVLGVEGAVEFLLTFGGAELYLTETPKNRSRLVKLVGRDKAVALAKAAEHMPRRVPTAKPWLAAVHSAWGLPGAEIARKLHVTDVTVRSYLKRYASPPADPRQRTFPGF